MASPPLKQMTRQSSLPVTILWLLVQGRNLTPNMLAACSVLMAMGALSTSGYDHSMTCSERQIMSVGSKSCLRLVATGGCWGTAEAAGLEPVKSKYTDSSPKCSWCCVCLQLAPACRPSLMPGMSPHHSRPTCSHSHCGLPSISSDPTCVPRSLRPYAWFAGSAGTGRCEPGAQSKSVNSCCLKVTEM